VITTVATPAFHPLPITGCAGRARLKKHRNDKVEIIASIESFIAKFVTIA
jgi:hypothetical protein